MKDMTYIIIKNQKTKKKQHVLEHIIDIFCYLCTEIKD